MTTANEVQNRILKLVSECKEIAVDDFDASLFSGKYGLIAMDMTYLLLQLKREFEIDLNEVIRRMDSREYSVKSLTDTVMELINR